MTDHRTSCAVTFCKRSKAGRWAWWLCKDHYRLVSLAARATHRKAKAMCKRRGWIETGKGWWGTTNPRAHRIMAAAGRKVIRSAQRNASGL